MAIGTRAQRGSALPDSGVSDTFAILGTTRAATVQLAEAAHPAEHAAAARVTGPAPQFANPTAAASDAVLFAISAGDPNDEGAITTDDAILRIGIDGGATAGNDLTRLFAGNADFRNIRDLSLDVDHGSFFVVDNNFDATSRILRYDLSSLTTGVLSTPTTVFATDTTGEAISSIEIDSAAQRVYWFDGDAFGADDGGYQLNSNNYAGNDFRTIKLIDFNLYNDPFLGPVGAIADFAIDRANGYAYAVMSATGLNGNTLQNHVLRISLASGATTYLSLGDTGGGQFHSGRLNPAAFGQISAIDVDQATGTVYFTTQALGQTDHGGVFSFTPGATAGDMVAGTLATLWQQPADNAYSTPQTFPTSPIQGIEFDEATGRYYLTVAADTPGSDVSIFVGQGAGTPALFQQVTASTAEGALFGMEIAHAATVTAVAGSAYVEQGPATTVFASVAVADSDNAMLKSATVSIGEGFRAGDLLAFTAVAGVTGAYDAQSGVLTISGNATLAQYQTMLGSVTFATPGDNPANDGANPTRTINLTTFDGLVRSDATSVTLDVTGVNDAPSTSDGTATMGEDGVYTFTAADFPFTDVDGGRPVNVIFEALPASGTLVYNDGALNFRIVVGALDYAQATSGFLTFVPGADYNGQVTIDFRVQDDGGKANGGGDVSDLHTLTIAVTAVDDAPVAVADTASTSEDAPVTIAVLDNDTDVDGGPKAVVRVAGTALAEAGDFAVLASGATVTLAADGTLVYDANGAFDSLVSAATAAAARASNSQAIDTFEYTLNGGSTATVSVTIDGVDGADPQFVGSAGTDRMRVVGDPALIDGGDGFDTLAVTGGRTFAPADGVIRNFELILVDGGSTLDLGAVTGNVGPLVSRSAAGQSAHITGTAAADRLYGGDGADELTGGDGNDTVFLTATPALASGGGGKDILVVRSGAHVTLAESAFSGFETLRIEDGASADLSGVDTRIGFIRLASTAGGGSEVTGSNGRDHIIGGDGDDVITGGQTGDLLTGGAGKDTFVYTAFRDIGAGFREEITDFTSGQDTIDLSALDPSRRLAGDQAFTFIGDRAFTGAGGADFEVRYEAQAGGVLRVEFDTNHDGVVDYGMLVHAATLQASDFVL